MPDDQVSVEVNAPPDRVWRLVSDITAMGRWSPETFRTRWLRGWSRAVPGAKFTGYNRWGVLVWATKSVVEVADPGREFTFSTVVWGKKRTRWSYTFEPAGEGTRMTEARTHMGNTWFRDLMQRYFMHGHSESYPRAMLTTLRRIKQAAEAGRSL